MTTTTFSYVFNAEAAALLPETGLQTIGDMSAAVPVQGDVVRFPWISEVWFKVIERQFEYDGKGNIRVLIVLGPI